LDYAGTVVFSVYNFQMRSVILVFAKAPVPGGVKTRLIPPLTAPQAAALHQALVRDTLASLASLAGRADLALYTDIPTDAWNDLKVARAVQSGGDLGQRLLAALQETLGAGRPQAMVLGSDSPTLPVSYLSALLDSSSDVALGPTEDGGYYAIAAKRVHPEMFTGVRWSTPHALADTIQAVARCGLSVAIGRPWFDIDTPADLNRLLKEPVPAHTARWIAETPLQ
jgi:uncharacterized protein